MSQVGAVTVAFVVSVVLQAEAAAVVFQTLVAAAAAVIGAPNKSKKTGHPRQL